MFFAYCLPMSAHFCSKYVLTSSISFSCFSSNSFRSSSKFFVSHSMFASSSRNFDTSSSCSSFSASNFSYKKKNP